MNKKSIVVASILSAFSCTAMAEIFHYVDEFGRKVYVDRLSKVPSQYLDQLTSKAEPDDNLTEEERLQREGEQSIRDYKKGLNKERSQIKKTLSSLRTPYIDDHNRVMIPVKVRYGFRSKTLNLVIDTGASVTVVHKNAIKSFNPVLVRDGTAQIADGSVIETQRIEFKNMEIGSYKGNNISASVIDHKGGGNNDGLLGMDFLRQAKYEVDHETQLVIWDPERYKQLQARLEELDSFEEQVDDDPEAFLAAQASDAESSDDTGSADAEIVISEEAADKSSKAAK